MKILLLILLLPLYAIAQKEGHLVVSQSKQNFGKISLFDVLNKRMEVGAKYWCKNTGKVPIFINACQTGDGGCYCHRWPKEPILPGDSNVVSLVLDVSYPRLWDKSGTIIYSEEGIEYSARVYLKGEVYNDATQISYTNYTVDTSAERKIGDNTCYTITFKNTCEYPFKLSGNCQNLSCDDYTISLPKDTIHPGETGTIKLLKGNTTKKIVAGVYISIPFYRREYTSFSYIVIDTDGIPQFYYNDYPR